MLASTASSHYGKPLLKLQSDPNLVVSLRSSRTSSHLASFFPPDNSCIQFTLQRKFRPQSLLNQSVGVPPTNLAALSAISKTSRLSYFSPLRCGVSSSGYSANGGRSFRDWVELAGEVLSTAFPLWVTIGCALGLVKPSSFDWVTPKLSILGLTTIMLGMGMTLTLDDLRGALAMPKEVLSGFVLQYSVMPISGFLVSKLLNLPSHYAAGLILVGCCPGGTASNIVTYLARGNVALSVVMTAASTFASVVMTPFLTAKLAGKYVAVNAADLLLSTLQVVLLPVLAGAFLNQFFQPIVKFFNPLMPPVAVATVAILCGRAIAQSSSAILMSGGQVILASCLLHAFGFSFGYILARMLGIDVSSSRTISIEVGMQNSVLGVVLATKHFGDPLTTVPCAVSSVCHSIFGSALAGIWRRSVP
ncbi:probable sodium/metabolite cotransporter BASS1, chloroplastic [Neltuma alba]|uniref:probable sodium/metabolite cotransporter BASS1, chloroplastic n=1 Tax=Neltuma alba TaxID=207710 RepID=UPI0010A574C0|nr:probable sodium/metabolite cotransporter BASS1, chloroplastic [Prosopis alba]